MRKSYLILIALFLTFATNIAKGQGCVDMGIKRLVNFDTVEFTGAQYNNGIQLTCDFPQDTLTVVVFAPGYFVNPGSNESPYVWEEIPFNPPCPFNEGIQVPGLTGDDNWGSVVSLNYATPGAAIPFTFDFFGETYENCQIGSNGLISFFKEGIGTVYPQGSNCSYSQDNFGPFPNAQRYKNCIMVPYYDIIFSGGNGQVFFQVIGDYPCRKMILSYYQVPMFDCRDQKSTNMAVLYESSNTIEFYLLNKPHCGQPWGEGIDGGLATLGIQNHDLQICMVDTLNNARWEVQNKAFRIRAASELEKTYAVYKRSATDFNAPMIPVELDAEGRFFANPTIEEGPTRYFAEATIYRADGNEINISDSTAIYYPIDLDPIVVTHNGSTATKNEVCRGDQVNFQLSGGTRYNMVLPQQVENIGSTFTRVNTANQDSVVYQFEVINEENGVIVCTRMSNPVTIYNISFNVQVNDDMTICRGTEITLTDVLNEEEGESAWTTGQIGDTIQTTPQSTGYITLTKTNYLGCTASDSILVTVNDAPDIEIVGTMNICKGTSTILTVNSSLPNCLFEWSTGQTTQSITVNPASTQQYNVSVKLPPAMCERTDSATVVVEEAPNVVCTADVSICEGDQAEIGVNGDATRYIWESVPQDMSVNGGSQANYTVKPSATTMYVAHAYNQINCHSTDTVYVNVQRTPSAAIRFNPSVIDALDPTVIFTDVSSGNSTREWELSDGTTSTEAEFVHVFPVTDTTLRYDIQLTAYSPLGCSDTTSAFIRVQREHHLWAPTGVYLHDNNPDNARFRLWIDNIIEYDLKIFNRYGEMIFQTNDIEDAWDCTYKGEPVMQGVYTWSVQYRHNDAPNRLEREQGTFMIYN
ncbi:MAG: gliding motility-associated C-terminal domain-containing protein [Bacteroidales bacterium]|nr:gliding motility-associated C-terminal domain-containing protein [Bacteroidales bacterium]